MGELRLLSYNVRSLRDDPVAVAEVIRACEPDVVAVQEAPRFLRWRSKRAALARRCGMVVATADRPGGLMLMTTIGVEVEDTGFALLSKARRLHQRAVCWGDLSVRGEVWRVASVHFSLDKTERGRHLPEVLGSLAAPSAYGGPLVVAGDLNERPAGAVWTQLAERMQDAYAVAPDGPPDTYSSRRPHKRIDAVFADQGVEVVSCTAVQGGMFELSAETLLAASDHLPVLAVLRH